MPLRYDCSVLEVWKSCYDIRALLDATHHMMDGKKLDEIKLPFIYKFAGKKALKEFKGTIVEELLEKYHLI